MTPSMLQEAVLAGVRVTRWKGGVGSRFFNSCTEGGISAGVRHMHTAPGEIPSSSQQLTWQKLYQNDHVQERPGLLQIFMMKWEFYQVLRACK